jgi:tetrathionate reductase subunit B
MAQYGLYIDVRRCIGCYACVVGCKNWNQIDAGYDGSRISLIDLSEGEYPNIARTILPILCMQCENAPCIAECPVKGAIYRREDGIVIIDKDKCTGCKGKPCIPACPYGILYYREDEDAVDKCDFCVERIDLGLDPYCVAACPTEAMIFGDLDDPNSEVSKSIAITKAKPLLTESGTKPKAYYAHLRVSSALLERLRQRTIAGTDSI